MFTDNSLLSEVVAAPLHPRLREVATTLRFDDYYELLWAGSKSGELFVYECPSLENYSWFHGHKQRVEQICSVRDGAISISSSTIQLHTQGGWPRLSHKDIEGDLMSCSLDPSDGGGRGNRILLGRLSGAVSTFDMKTSQYVQRASFSEGSIGKLITTAPGCIAAGTSAGKICLLDPRAGLKVEHEVLGHSGGVVDLASKHSLLVSCGFAMRGGTPTIDAYVKVYDARSLKQSLTSVPFPAGPSFVEFHPKFSSTVVIGSSADMISVQDVQSDSLPQNYKLSSDGSGILGLAVSSSGDYIALAGARGLLRLWTFTKHGIVNLMSAPHSRPHFNPPPSLRLRENDPFNVGVEFPCTGRLLSDWDPATATDVGMPPRVIDPAVLENMKQVDFIGYVPNPAYGKGLAPGIATRMVANLRNSREQRKFDAQATQIVQPEQAATQGGGNTAAGVSGPELPPMYHFVEIKLKGRAKYAEFKFSLFNETEFAGLENGLMNSYCNSLIQILYYQPSLRRALLEHQPTPLREICLLDELALLFRMLSEAPRTPCQASNFLRALRHVPEASAMGLLDDDSLANPGRVGKKEMHSCEKMARLCRFMLEKMHREWRSAYHATEQEDYFSAVMGMKTAVHTQCLQGEKAERDQITTTFQIDLQYPTGDSTEGRNFCGVLEDSLRSESVMQAWFDAAHGDKKVRQIKLPSELPEMFVVNCATAHPSALQCWVGTDDSDNAEESPWLVPNLSIASDRTSRTLSVKETSDGTDQTDPPDYPQSESRIEKAGYALTAVLARVQNSLQNEAGKGHFIAHVKVLPPYHEENQGIIPLVEDIPPATTTPFAARSDASHNANQPPLPSCIATQIESTLMGGAFQLPDSLDDVLGIVDSDRDNTGEDLDGCGESSGSVLEEDDSEEGSCCIDAMNAHQSGQWVVFNDFSITPTELKEVLNVHSGRKLPCLLFYSKVSSLQRETSNTPVELPPALSAEQFDNLCTEEPLQGGHLRSEPTFKPLDMKTEAPRPGMLFALDAEFVVQGQVAGSGFSALKRDADATSRMILGRVSVVRGQGKFAGKCCIDDYVRPLEPIHDYVTRFSGLVDRDLDANTSQHHLTTLKKVYLKLRFLVDSGCVFVGHGLKQDFRIINIIVSQKQIIDTVELFHLKRHRMLSLRFLASYLLDLDIQSNTHDSIEDARTALQLYETYHRLCKQGNLQKSLREMYRWGHEHGWDPGNWIIRPNESSEELSDSG